MNRFIANTSRLFLIPVLMLLAANGLFALPDDEQQPIITESASSEFLLNEGVEIHRGTAIQPARIAQGSMVIIGQEIRVERDGNALLKVTATGAPARFEQQPELDQPVIYASGRTLVYDNSTRLFSADEDAELLRSGDTIRGFHIEYNLDTRTARADARPDGDAVRVVITPEED